MNLFDALTEIGPDGTLLPRLAVRWESTPDVKTWTFTIRRDATFHNGQPVTIDDVIWSFQKLMDDNASPTRVYVTNVKSVERVSDDTLRFNLIAPFALWDRQVMMLMILPKDAYLQMGARQFGLTPIGSGPYKFVRWVKDDRVELEAFDQHWQGVPKIRRVVFRPVPSEAARATALVSGEVDIVPNIGFAETRLLAARSGVQVRRAPGFKVVYMGFNTEHPALKDVKMRQAVDYAIDRNAITGQLLRGMAKPIGQIVSPAAFGYDESIKPTPYDPAKARALIKEAGYGGEPIPFAYANDLIASGRDVAQAVAGYLEAVGIKVQLEGLEYNSFYPLWTARKLPGMHMFVYGGVLLDADTQIQGNYMTGGRRGYIFDPRVDALGLQQRGLGDKDARKRMIADIWKIAGEYKPYVYLHNEDLTYAMRTGIEWNPPADGIIRIPHVTLQN